MRKIISYGALILTFLAIVATGTAGALLGGTAFGFPKMVQSGTTTAFNQDFAQAFNNEAVNVGLLGASSGFGGFPGVSQSAVQGQTLRHVDFEQTTQTASLAYPLVDTGLGFAGFGMGGFGSGFGFGGFC
ncbi:hypothetical protein [Methanocella arvoryzae]|uniref:Uncharacterized protein n=1 Tax=Methanocella arvoryzae (strain DSM 22066 / NBRC 105507 / MRE50) TaxID=351160 RepID=Q0W855_METAR|nr:hypothetical protein [Methanocella arvoryzae]CAJ35438.1 hypothetical protein LRC492 [Methanocella arvoryzae MRE50]